MLIAVDTLFNTMLGEILPAWLSVDAIQYLIGLIIFSVIFSVIINIFRRR